MGVCDSFLDGVGSSKVLIHSFSNSYNYYGKNCHVMKTQKYALRDLFKIWCTYYNGDYILIQTLGGWCWFITQDSPWVGAIKILMGLSLLLKPTWLNACDVSHCSNSLGIDFSTDKCTLITLFKLTVSDCSNSLGHSTICCGWAFQMKLFFVIFVRKLLKKMLQIFVFV